MGDNVSNISWVLVLARWSSEAFFLLSLLIPDASTSIVLTKGVSKDNFWLEICNLTYKISLTIMVSSEYSLINTLCIRIINQCMEIDLIRNYKLNETSAVIRLKLESFYKGLFMKQYFLWIPPCKWLLCIEFGCVAWWFKNKPSHLTFRILYCFGKIKTRINLNKILGELFAVLGRYL